VNFNVSEFGLDVIVKLQVKLLAPFIVHSIAKSHIHAPMCKMLTKVTQIAELTMCYVVSKLPAKLVAVERPIESSGFTKFF